MTARDDMLASLGLAPQTPRDGNAVAQAQSPLVVSSELTSSTSPSRVPAPVHLYSHQAMVDLMIANPDWTRKQLAEHFGRPPSWMASVLASNAFQATLDPYRDQIRDPAFSNTLQERFKALAIHATEVTLDRLNSEKATDFIVIKAGEMAVKALGLGVRDSEGNINDGKAKDAPRLSLEERLLAALDKKRAQDTIDAEDVTPKGDI